MKKLSIIALLACGLFATSCSNDATLDETRVADVTAPTVDFEVSVAKSEATFTLTSTAGNPAAREVGVMVSTEAQPTVENSAAFAADENGVVVATLDAGTTYYAVAYALTANQLVTSEVKTFATEPHPLGAYIGKKTMSAGCYILEDYTKYNITITPDENDETVAYLNGILSSQVGMNLGDIKMVFDVANNTVTIPANQVTAEPKYGDFCWVQYDEEGATIPGDIVGTLENGVIKFNSLAAEIVAGGNAGLCHVDLIEIEIK